MNGGRTGTGAVLLGCLLATTGGASESGPGLRSDVAPLVEASCRDCHDRETKTLLDIGRLGYDLSDPVAFRSWERIYDRLSRGEMPPSEESRPDAVQVATALETLERHLRQANEAAQKAGGRVPVRRLTRVEYEHSLHDLLGIGTSLAKLLPAAAGGGGFDNSVVGQRLSPVHIQSYFTAADRALDDVMQLGREPRFRLMPLHLDYVKRPYIRMWFERPIRNGGGTIKADGDELVTFEKRGFATRSDHAGFRPQAAGFYRLEMTARAYQAKTPVTLAIMKASEAEGGSEMVGSYDLYPDEPRRISLTTYLTPAHYFYPIPLDDDVPVGPRGAAGVYGWGAQTYPGEGVAIKDLTIQGPLADVWPPGNTREFFAGLEFLSGKPGQGDPLRSYDLELTASPLEHLRQMIGRIAPVAFRRPLHEGEADVFVDLARPALAAGRAFDQAVRVAFRALFTSPQFLFQAADPGPLDDYALAARLAGFLWKSLPDAELSRLAGGKRLTDPGTLAGQVDRMLDDEKSDRFMRDFLDQWAGLRNIDATTPDARLYPEYDDALRQAMLQETRRFLRELVDKNLPSRNLVDASFTFLNRRLAEHYGIPGIDGEQFRRVALPRSRVRGGLLTQASILKVTANGTVTSPVKRGNFVLSTLLGTPPNPPPPGVGAIEADTRGTTTIRETLDRHRHTAACAACHRRIDPPGFALESFDPIGGFRDRYRSTGVGDLPKLRLNGRPVTSYRLGLPVDSSGVTEEGTTFAGIREFKRLLLKCEDDVARNLLGELIAYATGGEIQFADRDQVAAILVRLRVADYPVRSMIHEIVQSRMFRNK